MVRAPVRSLALLLLGLAPLLAASRCGGGDGSGGSPAVFDQSTSDPRCAPLADPLGFPPGYDFVPDAGGGAPRRVLVATSGNNLIALDVERVPFRIPSALEPWSLPADADGDGRPELRKSIDDIQVEGVSLALVTVSGDPEAVLFFDPAVAQPRSIEVSVPAAFDPADFAPFPGLPAPGTSRTQTGVTAAACVAPGGDALDSRGDRLADAIPEFAWCNGPGSFRASFPAGVAIVGGRLFVATSNLGRAQGQPNTQYLPGSVVVFDLDDPADPAVVSPAIDTPDGRPYVVTTAFNPSELTRHDTVDGRRLLLVTQTGAIGIPVDDPGTDELEGGVVRISEGAIDVLDADALEIVATIPLREANPEFGPLGIDPTGRVALFGDVGARWVLGIDLAALEGLPAPGAPGLPVDLESAVIFDGLNPLEIPLRPDGAPPVRCPGQVGGVAFAADGRRAYALERCDGTVAAFDVDLAGDPSLAELRDRITFSVLQVATAPLRDDTVDLLRSPAALRVRPGVPGVDYAGPDLFFTIGDPEGYLCGVRIDSR